jgi:hypothetical protein
VLLLRQARTRRRGRGSRKAQAAGGGDDTPRAAAKRCEQLARVRGLNSGVCIPLPTTAELCMACTVAAWPPKRAVLCRDVFRRC